MKQMPLEEQPYEKLEKFGSKVLTDAELLAIILRTGTKDTSSLQVARDILDTHGRGLSGIHVLSENELQRIKGIGRVKALQLKAIAEISARLSKSMSLNLYKVTSPKSVAQVYMEEMRYLEQEHIKVVFLDTKNGIIADKTISVGTVNASLVDPREIFKEALRYKAVSIIMLHNHPSGDPEPSEADVQVTRVVRDAGRLLNILLIDHIVIGDGSYISFKEKGIESLL